MRGEAILVLYLITGMLVSLLVLLGVHVLSGSLTDASVALSTYNYIEI